MTTKNKRIVFVNENRMTLPKGLIPNDVTMFEYERKEDGRIVLTPFSKASSLSSDFNNSHQERNGLPKLGKVIDFHREKAIRRHHSGKKEMGAHQDKSKEGIGNEDPFVGLHLFPSRLEAEMTGEILKQSDIPFLIQSEDIGIFGPGASPAPGGARLVVRKADLEAAKSLLAGLI